MFREYMQKLSDQQLIDAFGELQDSQSLGILKPGGEVRRLMGVYKDFYSTTEPSISTVEKEIYYEMAMRYYVGKER
uniref:hypothetical protein n=1 Tax=Clostridium sp. 12(A) TaxID=1163671 RepID=UPI0004631F59|nr:hypothetical protein [Clostridium sp. 12(A)]